MPDLIMMLVYLLEDAAILPHITPQDVWNSLNKEQIKNECRCEYPNESSRNSADYLGTAGSTTECTSRDANTIEKNSH